MMSRHYILYILVYIYTNINQVLIVRMISLSENLIFIFT